jgi:hypothetical protein
MRGNILALLFTSVFSAVAVAAPLCSEVLQTVDISNAEKVIENIAHLKMDLDLAKVQGKTGSTAMKSLRISYPEKYQVLVSGLKNKYSEAQIAELVRQKISELQGNQRKENEEVEISKERIKEVLVKTELRPSQYHLESTIPFDGDFDSAAGSPFRFLPDGRLLYPTPEGLHIFDLVTKKDFDLRLDANAYEVDGYRIVGQLLNNLFIFDLQTQKVVSKFTLPPKAEAKVDNPKVMLSPDKAFALLTGRIGRNNTFMASCIDLQTGKEVFNQDHLPANVTELKVLDDKYLLAVIDKKHLQRIEIATGKVEQSIELVELAGIAQLNISVDRKHLVVLTHTHSYALNPYDLSSFTSQIPTKDRVSSLFHQSAQTMPGLYPEVFGFNSLDGPRILNVQNLQDVFRFNGKYGKNNNGNFQDRTFATVVSDDKAKIAVIYTLNNSRIFIDTWGIND